MHIVVWSQGRQAAKRGQDVEAALGQYTESVPLNGELQEIFRDGYEDVNRDYAEDLDAAQDFNSKLVLA
jgi:hypothetical protein